MNNLATKTISIEDVIELTKDYRINNFFNTSEGIYADDKLIDNPFNIDSRDLYSYLIAYHDKEYIKESYGVIKRVEDALAGEEEDKPAKRSITLTIRDNKGMTFTGAKNYYQSLDYQNKEKVLSRIGICFNVYNQGDLGILFDLIKRKNKVEIFKDIIKEYLK